MPDLTSQQIEALRVGLEELFWETKRFQLFLRQRLEKNLLDSAVENDPEPIAYFRVLLGAEAEGWIEKLVMCAHEEGPRNRHIATVALELGLVSAPITADKADLDAEAEGPPETPLCKEFNPYRGLLALREEDTNFLFGRDEEVEHRLASAPYDPLRIGEGTLVEQLNADTALTACDQAIRHRRGTPRYSYQRARALQILDQRAAKANGAATSAQRYQAYLSALNDAIRGGYPIAFHNMSVAYNEGEGVEKDEAKAADFPLEAFNRVVACCAANVDLLKNTEKYEPETVRRVARELLPWAAALGNARAHQELARLYEGGTLVPPALANVAAKAASYEHGAIAGKIAASKTDQATGANAPMVASTEGLTAEEVASIKARVDAWKPAGFGALPPWLAPPTTEDQQSSELSSR